MNSIKTEKIKRIHDTFMLLTRISKRWFVQRLQTYGLTLPQFVTLASLAAHRRPATMSDLTSVTFHDPPTMTGVIDRLVKLNLVERTRSQTDRRVVLVEATTAGIELFNTIEREIMNEMSSGYSILTEAQLDNLEELLQTLLRVHLMQCKDIHDSDVDQEIERLGLYMCDPIDYHKSENGKAN